MIGATSLNYVVILNCIDVSKATNFAAFFGIYLIIVQRDATQCSQFIILQIQSTCFGCQPHPSSGLHKTVTTASGTGRMFVQLPPSIVVTIEGGVVLCYVVLCYFILCHVMLCYVMLCYVTLCYVMLCYVNLVLWQDICCHSTKLA